MPPAISGSYWVVQLRRINPALRVKGHQSIWSIKAKRSCSLFEPTPGEQIDISSQVADGRAVDSFATALNVEMADFYTISVVRAD